MSSTGLSWAFHIVPVGPSFPSQARPAWKPNRDREGAVWGAFCHDLRFEAADPHGSALRC
ncbi:MAG: hypothetical protein HYZ53_24775 [Planctomycetes bacterium]|nr:hypothetical protein [Planctomycetota bacterium]